MIAAAGTAATAAAADAAAERSGSATTASDRSSACRGCATATRELGDGPCPRQYGSEHHHGHRRRSSRRVRAMSCDK